VSGTVSLEVLKEESGLRTPVCGAVSVGQLTPSITLEKGYEDQRSGKTFPGKAAVIYLAWLTAFCVPHFYNVEKSTVTF